MFWFALAGTLAGVAVVHEGARRVAVRRACARVVAVAENIAVEAAALRDVEERLWRMVDEDDWQD